MTILAIFGTKRSREKVPFGERVVVTEDNDKRQVEILVSAEHLGVLRDARDSAWTLGAVCTLTLAADDDKSIKVNKNPVAGYEFSTTNPKSLRINDIYPLKG